MPLPTFMVIGAAKCGTTSLCALLQQHPDVFLTRPKEPNYFGRITNYECTRKWYESLFAGSEGYGARGEGSTTYSAPKRIEIAAPRIRTEIPDCRLIYIVRHPIRRIESHWKQLRRGWQVAPTINAAVEQEPTIATLGLYWRHLCVYRRLFPDDQILVVFLEDFERDPGAVLERVYTHVGVDPTFRPADARVPHNAATAFQVDTRLSRIARHIPGFRVAKRLAPHRLVAAAQRSLLKPYEERVEWRPETLQAIGAMYRDDSRNLLEHCGKDREFWDLGH